MLCLFITPRRYGERSIAISLSVCVHVCLSTSLEPLDRSSRNFVCRSTVAMIAHQNQVSLTYFTVQNRVMTLWLGPTLAALRYVIYRPISGVMGDVTFGRNGPYGDAWKDYLLTYLLNAVYRLWHCRLWANSEGGPLQYVSAWTFNLLPLAALQHRGGVWCLWMPCCFCLYFWLVCLCVCVCSFCEPCCLIQMNISSNINYPVTYNMATAALTIESNSKYQWNSALLIALLLSPTAIISSINTHLFYDLFSGGILAY